MAHRPLAALAVSLTLLAGGSSPAGSAELTMLTGDNWEEYAPEGKEVDCILGDYVLRNEHVVAVIARPVASRNANMTVRGVGGMLIDLTERARQNDQLSSFYAGGGNVSFSPPAALTAFVVSASQGRRSVGTSGQLDIAQTIRGETVALQLKSRQQAGRPDVLLAYSLTDGDSHVLVHTTYTNASDDELTLAPEDMIRADRTFAFDTDPKTRMFWAADDWFGQTYAVIADDYSIGRSQGRSVRLQYVQGSQSRFPLAPGASLSLRRKILPGNSLLQTRGLAAQLMGQPTRDIVFRVRDSWGPVNHAKIRLRIDGRPYASGRTDRAGRLACALPADGRQRVRIEALGRPPVDADLPEGELGEYAIEMSPCGMLAAKICDERGGPIPCKVAFFGKSGTADPDFGPDGAAVGVKNLHYSHNGTFRQELAPGDYEVLISYGPEYDAVLREVSVQAGREATLSATLRRSIDTRGWVSSDFHSHSSPSGDNTSSQLGRVLNLLCEHIEFAPCTEHNRIDTYVPHLDRLGVRQRMATCCGVELTGGPLPVNHQNAFPLVRKPRTQDGGAPRTDVNPVVQIQRLAMWDEGSEKLVQENHPAIPQIFGDRDLDGTPDGGFADMFGYMDAIEVHPPETILLRPGSVAFQQQRRNPLFHWLQLLNLGHRITGVVNTDAHYTFHDSGWLRNWIKSPTDDPAEIDTMEMVRATEAGNVVMSNGPFLQVSLAAEGAEGSVVAGPGDSIAAPRGQVILEIRVQCANWLDINRVQVFVNGRPREDLNFTRREKALHFRNDVVKFEAEIPLHLESDAHVIVAAAGEDLQLGRVMGPRFGKRIPIAVANPIFVDTDADGFQANGDLLDVPLPGAGD